MNHSSTPRNSHCCHVIAGTDGVKHGVEATVLMNFLTDLHIQMSVGVKEEDHLITPFTKMGKQGKKWRQNPCYFRSIIVQCTTGDRYL
jgi:hypothetical protein